MPALYMLPAAIRLLLRMLRRRRCRYVALDGAYASPALIFDADIAMFSLCLILFRRSL